MSTLEIKNIHAQVVPQDENEDPKPILHGVNLTVNSGETHAIMGPNGSGKSCPTPRRHFRYEITEGRSARRREPARHGRLRARPRRPLPRHAVPGGPRCPYNFLRPAATAVRGESWKLRQWVKAPAVRWTS